MTDAVAPGDDAGAAGPRSGAVALIGGTGALPAAVVAALSAQGRPVMLCEFEGFAFESLDDLPRLRFRIETLAELLADLRAMHIADVCFAGAVRRPAIDPARITPASRALVARLADAMRLGDDGALRTVIAIFQDAGFAVASAASLAPDLLPPPGCLTGTPLPASADADLAAARAAHARMAAQDAGQAVVVRHGAVLACEGPAGTDAMLRALASSPPAGSGPELGGILYKAPKPMQDLRADMPVIGPATVRAASDAGLAGIVIAAGGVMVLDLARVVALADELGICLAVLA